MAMKYHASISKKPSGVTKFGVPLYKVTVANKSVMATKGTYKEIQKRLKNMNRLKNEEERDEFLNELDSLTDDFPEDFFKMRILPELLKSVEFGGGGPSVFGAILKIGLKMSEDEFESRILPLVIKLFARISLCKP